MKLQRTKRRWLIIPALLLASAAHAQNSITLYGLVDEGLNFTSNAQGHSAYQMKSGDFYGSRWGFKGSEDLGDGYRAIFQLENGFNASNGAPGHDSREFGRQAYVGPPWCGRSRASAPRTQPSGATRTATCVPRRPAAMC